MKTMSRKFTTPVSSLKQETDIKKIEAALHRVFPDMKESYEDYLRRVNPELLSKLINK